MRCVFGNHDCFFQGEGKLQTTGMRLLGLDWLNEKATCVVCAHCSRRLT
jgi:hypothetical protein